MSFSTFNALNIMIILIKKEFTMFIIFGTKTRIIKENSGHFVCPECEILRPYWLKILQSWFTFFFIPLFPVGEKKKQTY